MRTPDADLPAGAAVLPQWAEDAIADAREAAGDAKAALAIAERIGRTLPLPGGGETAVRWRVFAEIAAVDLTVARALEAHSDALAILAEAGQGLPDGTWGVFAAEAPGVRLDAVPGPGGARLDGTKPWCSLAGHLDHALVTGHVDGGRGLYAVDLLEPHVQVEPPSGWVARGLSAVPSVPVHFTDAPARAIGEPGWYLRRPGFAWGGIGVAACWLGGARAIADTVRRAPARDGDAGAVRALHVGALDVRLHSASTCLADAAGQVDAGAAVGPLGALLALRVRSAVADAAEEAITRAGHALGPGSLAFDEQHARRVADLQLYVRQHHAERDLVTLGRLLMDDGAS